ncbi:hypothetical protein GCQ56_05475 [Marinifilum sp. N1E240]|uniref:polysaccharide pyruvyl transferase family protein n=1 Tax=Marinifilum sp. N1E240 TaxID=2608082 RepID=UPI00128AF2EC|nr:polysaccharide pyruvyl transferase family protein [Marinifilum sp. N1E240]MPQ46454.1 hypothetical protein [Marinifilum sp. N1E240]
MKIQIDGTGTENKGAELMLYSILEEIEHKMPTSRVTLNSFTTNLKYIKTNLKVRISLRQRLIYGPYIREIINRLKLPYHFFTDLFAEKNIDLVIDAGGFRYGDQWKYSDKYIELLEKYYRKLKENGTKIIFLPQAFGPFNLPNSKKTVEILNNYVDLIVARDNVSKEFLLNENVDPKRILVYPDFTFPTKGITPRKYSHLEDAVCIIPNRKMYSQTNISKLEYYELFEKVITEIQNKGKHVFILNHEGIKDLKVCRNINNRLTKKVEIVNNLNAKEIKGVIGNSYLVISSRYHGVASALSQCVPCIATSWSHKYELLFGDFGIDSNIVDINNEYDILISKIISLLDPNNNNQERDLLQSKHDELINSNSKMWKEIWEGIDLSSN